MDTNLLFHAFAVDRPQHSKALAWLESIQEREDVFLSEFVLVEFYRLLRNPAVVGNPLKAEAAAEVVGRYRRHPLWRVGGFPEHSKALHEKLWKAMAAPGIAYRRIYDMRLALILRQYGVTEFATCNVKDFEGLGFKRLWNPLEE